MAHPHRIHEADCAPEVFEDALAGRKQHDLRQDGVPSFEVGDVLRLREFDSDQGSHSGRSLDMKITYITSAGNPCALSPDGLAENFCILSLQAMT